MKLGIAILLITIPSIYSQLYAIASGGASGGTGSAGSCCCPGYLRFAGRAALNCNCNSNQAGGGCCCPCPGQSVSQFSYGGYGAASSPQTFILNACVPACCPDSMSGAIPVNTYSSTQASTSANLGTMLGGGSVLGVNPLLGYYGMMARRNLMMGPMMGPMLNMFG
uniref:Uncharacterized protein n=1 Tax=Haemonchus contortus TaxID=6289 RepID=A0A7I4YNC2_HAECO